MNATHRAGNARIAAVNYRVSYGVCVLYDPMKVKKSGSTIPITLQTCDASGRNHSAPEISLTATGVRLLATGEMGPAEDAGNANPDEAFRVQFRVR